MAPGQSSNDDLLGIVIAGRYRIISKLGEGGMGVAYRAWYEQGGVPVVIKLPHRMFFADPKFAQRFYREIQVLQGLFHPHIVPIVDVGIHEDLPYVAMRFLPGGSLSNRRLRDSHGKPRPNPASTLHLWLPAVAEALDYVHSQGVVHRDVKPTNIFFDAFWGAYLGDFGIAKIVEESETFDKEHTLTATHMGIGTQPYMCPEQFTPKAVIDGRADQYALAVTVYEILAGERPFTGSRAHLIVEVTNFPVPPLQARRSDLPSSLVQAVHKGLAKNPADRFATCREFATAALRDVPAMADEPGVARLLCPKCDNILKLPIDAAGQKGKCPKCQTAMKVAEDLGALWLLDEARRQKVTKCKAGEPSEIDPVPTDRRADEEYLEDFKPISDTGPVSKPYSRPLESLTVPLLIGFATFMFGVLLVSGTLKKPKAPQPQPKPEQRAQPIYERQLAAAQEKLRTAPASPSANEFLGTHWCFREQNWQKGLPYLAKSSALSLSTLAQKEIDAGNAKPVAAGGLIAVARNWWEFAKQKEANTEASSAAIRKHAADVYLRHVGVLKADADIAFANKWLDEELAFRELVGNKRPFAIGNENGNLLAAISLSECRKWGRWTQGRGEARSDNSAGARVEIGDAPKGEYDFTIVFTPLTEKACVTQLLWAYGSGVSCDFGGWHGQKVAFQMVNGSQGFSNPSTKSAPTSAGWLQKGRRHTAVIRVRRSSIAAYLDGVQITQIDTDYSNLNYREDWAISSGKLGIGSWDSPTIFHEARITRISP